MSRHQPECDCNANVGARHQPWCNALKPVEDQNPAVAIESERQARDDK
jgi:hypothetical protein